MAKNLLLYDKYNKVINTTMDVKGTTGYITIENLIPDTDYPEGEFYVGWEVEGKILPKATVPEFTTLRQMREKLVIVYFSDLTEQQLVDIKGDSAYKVALDNGFNGTQKEWLESLKGEQGEQGEPGKPGRDGVDITEGGSAYEIALAEGFQGTREEWLESLKGEPGEPGEKGDPGEDGFGVDGASAYEIALENGFVGNIQDFLDSLVGEPGKDGQDGQDGLSAYQIALENGFTGTEQEWLETLKGGLTGTENWQKRKVTSDDGTVITVDKPNLNAPDTYFTNSGFYYVTTSTGFPEGVSANGYVTFLIRNPNYSIMTFQPYNSERVFTKAKLNGNWGFWNEIGGRKEDRITSDYVVEIVMNTIENEISILRSTINEDSMYSEIDYLSYIDSVTDTKYTVTTIPTEDSNGYPIKLNRGYANDDPNDGSLETAREFALRKNASFVTNASVFDTSTGKLLGRQMDNGTIINNTPHRENYTLTIDNDRTLNAIPSTTNLEDITTSIDALTAFFPIILNGEKVDPSVYSSIPNTGEKNPRQIIAQKEDGTILVISVQGRGINGQGMDYEDTYRICSELGVKFAYHLDGGGSMQTNVRGSIITNPIDENGTKERKVKDFLYVTISEDIRKNRSNQKEFSNHSKNISDIQVKMDKLSKDFANMGTIPNVGDFKDTATFVSDANTIRQSGMYWVTNATLNTPKDYSYGLFHWQVNPTSALQMIVPFHINLGETLIRRTNGSMDAWTSWRFPGSKLDSIMDKVYKTRTSVNNIYVSKSGTNNGDGTENNPFNTIQKAVDSIPKLIEKDHFIKVDEGEYDENVIVKGIIGSAVWISRKNGIVDPSLGSTGVKVKSITFFDCVSYCKVESIESFNSSGISGQSFIRFSRCAYGTVHACRMADSSITVPSLIWDGSGGGFNSCYFDNQRTCVISMNGSAIRNDATNTHGTNKSDKGMVVQAGDVYYNGNVTWMTGATKPEELTQSGNINREPVTIELTTKNSWVHYNDDYKAKAIKMPDGMVYLYGIVKGGTPAQGSVAFTLPIWFRPRDKQIFGAFVADSTISKVLLDTTGNFAIETGTQGQYISLSGISFYAGN
ncbi:hypothetical protein vB_SscM-2_047 [Staphylococcus phage vB_SscM-2]|uniref:Phosphodiester glycosidase domain-containing protein n=1 Tax=Staphylococcus phage vB_SscM-2 TaxID=1868845 RepID=A0A1X9I9Y8_9CAUD|nr:hypothetical protein vB_SscM-2_047 [Staphylococcus phage vB_SscM-2]